ncbi:MAG: mannose-1-phosphate guanylyltransferase/mannose-6-phosphate isomerase, partial [Candidatus Competibacteraceae bacterium]|nr:mannose-1-phosphate guanylyltransferase/mannose-6-phosphate isomerase [Candidatus Competibacteraceae bacterium]
LVTFGIVPTSAETGYGYIRRGALVDTAVFAVEQFVEKPDQTTAQQYLDAGTYYWNSGMFMFRADVYLRELESQQPAMVTACRTALEQARVDLDFVRLDKEAFAACPA